jgi:nitrogen regulatory protein PII-like uncharacterized protein
MFVKSLLQKACFSLVMLALAVMPLSRLAAQSAAEPAIVVSIATLEEQMNDLTYFAEAAGMKPMMMMAKAQLDGFTRGIDRTKPAGAMMFFDADSPMPKTVFFMPISKMDDVLDNLAQMVDLDEDAEPMRMSANGQDFYLQQSGSYAFISDQTELLKNLPSNPATLVGNLPEKFNIGARIFPKRVPQELRDMMMGLIEQGAQQGVEGDGIGSELQQQNLEMQMAQMKSMINETEELELGFSIDKAKQNLHFDVQMVGDSGSTLAKGAEAYLSAKTSRFSGFLVDNSAVTANVRVNYSKEDIENATTQFKDLHEKCMAAIENNEDMSEDERQLAEKLAEQVFDVIEATVKSGQIDGGMCMVMDDSSANIAAGFQCVDASKLESVVKDLVAEAEKRAPGQFEVKLNAMKKFGANFHKFVVPVPDEEAQKMFGEKATLYLGVGSDVVYIGLGTEPMELLEKAISGGDSDKAGNGMSMSMHLAPILRKAAQMQNEQNMQAMADKLAESKRDRVRVNMSGIERGVTFTLEIQDGILELIGLAAQQMGGMMGGPGADF